MRETLISIVYDDKTVLSAKICVNEFKIGKIILLTDKNPVADAKEKQRRVVAEVKKLFSDIIPVEAIPISLYDIKQIAKDVVGIIDAQDKSEKIIVNVSHGRKPQAWAAYFAALKRIERINKIVYITEETKEIIELPKIKFSLSEKQITILKNIKEVDIDKISKKVVLENAMIYRHIQKLQEDGFLEKKNGTYELTDAGLIAIL